MCVAKKVIWNELDSFPYTPRVLKQSDMKMFSPKGLFDHEFQVC